MKKEVIYLIAYYSMRPKARVNTQIKGWMDNANNIQYDEQVAVATKLKKADQEYAKIILDMTNKKVVRNRWNNNQDFDAMFEYFAQGYPRYTYEIMGRLDPDYATRFMKQIATPEEVETITKELAERDQIKTELTASVTEETVVVDTADLAR